MNNFWKNKKVVVTGAGGFIGSHAVRALIEKGARVTAVVSLQSDKKHIDTVFAGIQKQISVKKVDLLDFKNCLDVSKGQDIILNFAAMDGGSEFKKKYSAQIFKVNTEIVLHMLDAAVANKVDRFLLMSSIEVYPKNAKTPIKEEYALQENFNEKTNGYVWSKRFGEIAAKMYAREYGLKIAIARPGNVYGPGDNTGIEKGRVIPTFIHKILNGEKIELFEGGIQKKQFIYVDDLVNTLLELVEKYPVCDPINIAGNELVTIKQLSEVISGLLKGLDILKKPFEKKSSSNRVISIAKAERNIKFYPQTSLVDGLMKTITYYKSKKYE